MFILSKVSYLCKARFKRGMHSSIMKLRSSLCIVKAVAGR